MDAAPPAQVRLGKPDYSRARPAHTLPLSRFCNRLAEQVGKIEPLRRLQLTSSRDSANCTAGYTPVESLPIHTKGKERGAGHDSSHCNQRLWADRPAGLSG